MLALSWMSTGIEVGLVVHSSTEETEETEEVKKKASMSSLVVDCGAEESDAVNVKKERTLHRTCTVLPTTPFPLRKDRGLRLAVWVNSNRHP